MKFYPSERVHELVAAVQGALSIVLLDGEGTVPVWQIQDYATEFVISLRLTHSIRARSYAVQLPVSRRLVDTLDEAQWRFFKGAFVLGFFRKIIADSTPAADSDIVYHMTYGVGEEPL